MVWPQVDDVLHTFHGFQAVKDFDYKGTFACSCFDGSRLGLPQVEQRVQSFREGQKSDILRGLLSSGI